jgi:hypothetical protein
MQRLYPQKLIPPISLYADDVALFCHPSAGDTAAVREILSLFGRSSGLRVNFTKSSATPLRCNPEETALIMEQLGCPLANLPITYLGIPLTIRRPTAAQLQPIVDNIAGRLPVWKAGLMNKAGRLAMVKSVLCAIPIQQLLVYAPPKKSLKMIEKIKRGFLWAGRAAANGGHCHVNWNRVCRPIAYGGLGVQDIERAGLSLRLRWLWLSYTDDNRAWSSLELQFSDVERALFFASTTMCIGNGQRALFWEDRWVNGRAVKEIAPLLYNCIPRRRRKIRTVAEGLHGNSWARDIQGVLGVHEIGQYLQLWHLVHATTLSNTPDRLLWKWTASGTYTASSCYLATFHGSTTCYSWKLIWRTWAPPKVKFFHWLANQDRCWTAERLARHGLPHHPRCLLCDQAPESMHHLMLECPFTRQVWHEILAWLRMTAAAPDSEPTIMDWWHQAKLDTPKPLRKGLASATLLIPWMTWKHRNSCVFEGAQPSIPLLLSNIKEEVFSWAKAGAKGLRVVLPSTWDVH